EDGAEQKVATFNTEETPFAAALLLDTSGSMETRLTLGRSAAIRFLDGLREEDVAAVYSFDSKVEQWQDFSPGRDLAPKVFGLKTKLMTALNDDVLHVAAVTDSATVNTGGRYISHPGGQQLRDAFAAIADALGHQYTLAYRPVNRDRNGKWRAIDVKLSREGVTLRTRKGYRAPKS